MRELVATEFPAWAGLPVRRVASHGTVTMLFRVGDDRVARFPLLPGDPVSVRCGLEAEAAAARELLGRTRFATPRPVALGDPGAGYRLPWSVLAWIPGTVVPGNVLVSGRRLRGVLDVGGLAAADPALDLVAAWHLLERGPRAVLRRALDCDDVEWARGRAWRSSRRWGSSGTTARATRP